ncbi:ABC transporter [Alkalilimnicola ehrlichii]|uniref:ABC transporter n=1 Tax=Alkalilimnicola ehrlichii TaxID=351052 RepID=A0A3E0WPL6_9GAMM|nr:metal ABC transporter permease [Alkalilimnicola ehrlichii]RFA27021.1 ABC transporter [Alkalilimnicola ehrlichii]RFA34143.1 ABC transporter [Alkalilimnicola ehrlichii]
MNLDLLFDPLFRVPFFTGLLLAALLPILGLYLRLRGEWLAALGYAHIAGAGGVLAPLVGVPIIAGALGGGALVALAKGLLRRKGNDTYALFILIGWSVMLLGAAYSHHAQLIGQALIDGQLYFIGSQHLLTALVLGGLVVFGLPFLSRLLLREHLFPWHDRANGRPVRLQSVAFDLLAAVTIGLAATAMGVMAAFAVLFVPAWIAFALAPGWRWALLLAATMSIVAYLLGFVAAVLFDLPFGPALVAVLVLFTPLRLLVRPPAGRV